MVHSLTRKVKKLTTNLNLVRTLRLVWSVGKLWTTLSIILIFLESGLFFGSLYLLKLLVDKVAEPSFSSGTNHQEMLYYIIATAAAAVLYLSVKAISAYITELQAAKVNEYIDDRIHGRAIELDLAFYESPDYFDVLKRAKDVGEESPNAIVTSLIEIAKNIMSLCAIGSVLIAIDWVLLPLLVLFVLPTLLVRIYSADKLNVLRLKNTSLERKSTYLSTLITSDTSAKEVRGFGLGQYLKGEYKTIRMNLLSEKMKINRKRTRDEILSNSLGAIGFFCCIAYIAMGTLGGKTSVGDITLFLVAFPQSFNIMHSLSASISSLYQSNIFVNSIFELFDLKSTLKEAEKPVIIPGDYNIDLNIEGLSFSYPHAERPTLNNISLKIPSGKIVAVVGLNGAGKTTLIKLLNRLYDPTSGSITLGGIDIRKFKSDEYRKQISAVFQDFAKYNVTVSDNIRFGDIDGNRSHEEIVEAAKNSGAHPFVEQFPNGYDTMMGRIFEDGHEISIGQWQKLAIARSFYSPARFLILDEATSALDAMAEKELFDSFRESIGNRAALIISHRLSAVKHADYIYVLSGGEIKQHGTHDDLITSEGDYSRLFRNNLSEA